jgi:hypothetical protein
MSTFRDLVAAVLPRPFLQRLSAGWFGVLHGLTGDQLADGMSLAARMAWLKDPASPDDVLPLIGEERGMPRYPVETAAQYRTRLIAAWSAYKFAGSEGTIVAQFAAAGYPGVTIVFDPAALGPNGEAAPYWSQFWIYFPYSSGHPVTSHGTNWGAFNWGDGTLYGVDVTTGFYQLLHGITRKWKPSRWVCRGWRFQLADLSIVEIAFGI